MAAPLQRQTNLRVQVPGGEHSPSCRRETSMHLESSCGSVAAAFELARSVGACMAAPLHRQTPPEGAWCRLPGGKNSPPECLHLASRISRKLAPTDQSELAWRLRCKGKQTCVCKKCRLPGGKHSPPECRRQRRARTLSPPPPCKVQQPQVGSISRSLHGGSVAKASKPACAGCLVASTLHRSVRDEHAP